MKKTLSIFALAVITVFSACGPSAEELAKKEQATKDSIAAVEKARQDSLDSAMKAQMTADSIAQAEAAAANDASSKTSTSNKPTVKKDEPKQTNEEKAADAMEGRRGGATSTTPADAKKVEETKQNMNGRRGGK
jgi:hypothetical protein